MEQLPGTTQPTINPPLPTDRAGELLFQLGSLQCFWFPTSEEVLSNTMPHHVYWKDGRYIHHFGPFPTVYQAMSHYTYLVNLQKAGHISMLTPDLTIDKPLCPVVMVDFNTKKRVKFDELPGGEDAKPSTNSTKV